MRKVDLAWAAGFFDGEGCIYMAHNTAVVTVAQKEAEPLTRFLNIFKMGTITHRNIITPKGNSSHIHTYYIGGLDAILVLSLMLPYLTVKRQKALVAIECRKNAWKKKNETLPTQSNESLRLRRILTLRNNEQSFESIGRALGFSRQRAHQLYQIALTRPDLADAKQGNLI